MCQQGHVSNKRIINCQRRGLLVQSASPSFCPDDSARPAFVALRDRETGRGPPAPCPPSPRVAHRPVCLFVCQSQVCWRMKPSLRSWGMKSPGTINRNMRDMAGNAGRCFDRIKRVETDSFAQWHGTSVSRSTTLLPRLLYIRIPPSAWEPTVVTQWGLEFLIYKIDEVGQWMSYPHHFEDWRWKIALSKSSFLTCFLDFITKLKQKMFTAPTDLKQTYVRWIKKLK